MSRNDEGIECYRCGQVPEWVKGKDNKYCPECHFMAFAERTCCHVKGKWKDKPFEFIPWQRDEVIIPAYGTIKSDGNRQYRFIYVEVPKKSGKTELGSIIALYGLVGDGEPSPEVYSAAADRGQASLVYQPASYMANNSKILASRLTVIDSQKRIIDYEGNGFYQVLSAEVATKHGLNPSTITFDELHAQPNRHLYDVLTEDTDMAREQQIVFIMTTAGVYNPESIGYQVHEYALQVKRGIIDDPVFLPVVYCADKEKDNWEDEEVWKRVNPSIGHIFDLGKIRAKYKAAKASPYKENNFKRYRLNLWVSNLSSFIPMDDWDACDGDPDDLISGSRACFGGLDLSSVRDLTAFVLVFPPKEEDGMWGVIPYFFVPGKNITERSRTDNVPYDQWEKQKLITCTPGTAVKYPYVEQQIIKAAKNYDLIEVAYDPWGAVDLATRLEENEGIKMEPCRQGFKTMSGALKRLLALVLDHKLAHGGHPILRWNADNLVVETNHIEDVKPNKEKARERIDGVVALAMAVNSAINNLKPHSTYNERGIRTIEL